MADLDEIDRGILQLLQRDARNMTPVEMAEQLPVSDQTIRNRIQKLEEQGVLEGYMPVINYEKAGFPMRVQFTCTVPVEQRKDLAKDALELANVVRVEEMLSAKENLRVLAVTSTTEEVDAVSERLAGLGFTVESERLQRYEHRRPFNHFGADIVSEE